MAFKMNGKNFPSMLSIAKELGKSRIYRKDFDKYGIVEIDDNEVEEVKAGAVNTSTETEVKEEVKTRVTPTEDAGLDKDDMLVRKYPGVSEEEGTEGGEAESKEEKSSEEEAETKTEEKASESDEEKKAKRAEKRAKRREEKRKAREEANKPTPEALAKAEELQKKSGYTDIWSWAVDMKAKSAEEVYALAEELGLTWEKHETERINRMRAVMTLRQNLFPGQKRPKVRQSAWKGMTNEEIAKICEANNVEYTETSDDKITRMRMIKALKDAGINSPK